ncbi:hypothetical protein BH11PSE11_BH11PSE11_01760 [soil metagenome]
MKSACVLLLALSSFPAVAQMTAAYPYANFDSTLRYYRQGDTSKALKGFRELAEGGDAVSQYYLGLMIANGNGVAADPAAAVVWLEKSAVQGYVRAQNSLGELYFYGRGVTTDIERAREWFQKAANQGLAGAQRNLGHYYLAQRRVDYPRAIFWLEKATSDKDPLDELELATIYQQIGGEVAHKRMHWLRKAANHGVAEAQFQYGVQHQVSVPKQYAKALYWYQRADAQGHREAPLSIAKMYNLGWGVERDHVEEANWLCKAAQRKNGNAIHSMQYINDCLKEVAERGSSVAQYRLAYLLENPIGERHDYINAAIWYRKAAEQGESGSFYALGDLYARGLGVPQDPVLAKMLYILDGEGMNGRDHSSRIQQPLSEEQKEAAARRAKAWKIGDPLPEKIDPVR